MNEKILRALLKALEDVNSDGKSDQKMSITVIGKPSKEMMEKEGTPVDEFEDMKEEDYPDMMPSMIEKLKKMSKGKGC